MDRLIDRLPSPGGLALWLYALAFVVLPALLAYKGFVFVVGIVIFAIGVHPHIESIVAGRPVHFALNWRGKAYEWDLNLSIPNERWVVKLISWGLMTLTMLILPVFVFAVQNQSVLFYAQVERQLPDILAGIDSILEWGHDRLPGYVPEVDVQERGGWQGLSNTIGEVAGDAVKDIKALVQKIFGSVLGVLGALVGDWVKLIVAAIIVGTILSGWDKEVKMHRDIIAGGIRDDRLRANVLRYCELFQTGVSLFMIGYLEVAATLTLFYGLTMLVLPLGLGIASILFMAAVLGFVTAIPKIGGMLGMAVATLLMITNLEAGLGWFGFTIVSFGTAVDILIRAGLLVSAAKIFGLMEAYNYTPDIIGEKLGMTKMQIIATVLIWAVGAGFFGMIWGILISLSFQAALRLAQEVAEAEQAAPEETRSRAPETTGA